MHKSVNETPLSIDWMDSTGLFNIRIQAAESANTATLLFFQIQVVMTCQSASWELVTGLACGGLWLMRPPHFLALHPFQLLPYFVLPKRIARWYHTIRIILFLSGDFIKKGSDRKRTKTRSLVRCGVTARGGSSPVGLMKWFGEQAFPVRRGWELSSSVRGSIWTVYLSLRCHTLSQATRAVFAII